MRTSLALALLAILALPGVPARAFDITQMTDTERAAFDAEVRAYLIANPEILIDVSHALQAKQDAAQAQGDAGLIAANAAAIFADSTSFVGGNPKGDITLVEFLDYRCGYCRKAHQDVANLVKSDGNIRYVVKEFPILGDDSVLASRFAIAALRVAGPVAYQKINAGFYESFRGDVTDATLTAFAKELGLDPAPILAEMNSDAVTQIILANHTLGEKLQISGTPTFVLADQMMRGFVPLDTMRAFVAKARS